MEIMEADEFDGSRAKKARIEVSELTSDSKEDEKHQVQQEELTPPVTQELQEVFSAIELPERVQLEEILATKELDKEQSSEGREIVAEEEPRPVTQEEDVVEVSSAPVQLEEILATNELDKEQTSEPRPVTQEGAVHVVEASAPVQLEVTKELDKEQTSEGREDEREPPTSDNEPPIHELDDPENTDQIPEEYTEPEEVYTEPDYSYELSYFPTETLTELASYSWKTSIDNQKYTKGCTWSPDGTCCLVGVNGDGMHLMELPQDLYAIDKLDNSRTSSQLKSAVHIPEAGMVYDFSWYPFMNSSSPDTCLWISTRQHEPIHMWDAFDGGLRASYLGYDDADEVQAAIVVKFSDDGEKIFGGYKKSIKIFDTALPGRICTTIKIKQAASAFALTPTNPDLITTGTWNGTINLYDIRMPKNGCMSSMFGHKAGVTLVKYNYDASLLYSGSRKEDSLFIWDMRNFSEPLKTLHRSVRTNQRVFFDLSVGGYWLATGDTDGVLRLWNTTDGEYEIEKKFPLHNDCCNGISFHPSRPIIATSSGQFKFANLNEDSETKENEFPTDFENTLKFWWIGDSQNKMELD